MSDYKNKNYQDFTKSIETFALQYDNGYSINHDRQARLKAMVDEFGLKNIALAAGFTEKTLLQYIRVTSPTAIAENSVVRAEKWVQYHKGS